MKKKLMQKDAELDFSYPLEASLTDDERKADEILIKWRNEISNSTQNLTIHNFFLHNENLKKS